jgi:hypothetical protein
MTLDRRTCADITVTAAPVAAIISSTVITGRVIITTSSVVEVPAVVSVVIFVGLFTAYRCLAVLAHDLKREGNILLCFM